MILTWFKIRQLIVPPDWQLSIHGPFQFSCLFRILLTICFQHLIPGLFFLLPFFDYFGMEVLIYFIRHMEQIMTPTVKLFGQLHSSSPSGAPCEDEDADLLGDP